nr:RNA dependent RNA polymerase [Kacheliba Partiti-like virus]
MPLNTGTGYFNRHSYKTRALARLTRPEPYRDKPTSKGFFYNATYKKERHIIHNIKHSKSPRNERKVKSGMISRSKVVKTFFAKRTTMLYTRNHISLKPKEKCRPVYNVDPVFLKLEAMLTFPGMVQMRPMSSCVLYGYETIRGGCHYLDHIAKSFNSYFTIDWSSFDQRVPRPITDIYYTDFLESLLVISHDYSPTLDHHPEQPQPTDVFFKKMSNLLHCLHEWYNSMVYITADGYAYQRLFAGVPSGLLNTQLLDSFVNLYLIIDGLLEYGFSPDEIRTFKFFIMGDDNSGMTNLPLQELEKFIAFFETYAQERWNMTLSQVKSIITSLRNKIEVLGYQVNFGTPYRLIDKLVAQLSYPEHGLKPKYMSYRALGIAYAAAGQDYEFHQFCRDVYMAFIEDKADLTSELKDKLRKHLSGAMRSDDDIFTDINFGKFPSIEEVRSVYREWKGSLQYSPKWDYSYFLTKPFVEEENYITMEQYRKIHNISRLPVRQYRIDDKIIRQ